MNEIAFDVWAVLLSIGIFQGLFISPFLLRSSQKIHWLFWLVLLFTLQMVNYLAVDLQLYRTWPHWVDLTIPLIFAVGPLYFFYIRSLARRDPSWSASKLWHFTPVLFGVIWYWDFYWLPGEEKVTLIDQAQASKQPEVSWSFLVPVAIHVGQTLVYLILARRYLSTVGTTFPRRLKAWLRRFNLSFAGYWIITLIWLTYLTWGEALFAEVDYLFILSSSMMVHLLAFLITYHRKEVNAYLLGAINKKYEKSTLSSEQSVSILKKINQYMHGHKPYENPDLKIADVAQHFGLSSNIISQVLNQEAGKKFYEYINDYRLAAAIERLSDPKYAHFSILSIARESGFSNKATFNRLFKEQTGSTPSQFQKGPH